MRCISCADAFYMRREREREREITRHGYRFSVRSSGKAFFSQGITRSINFTKHIDLKCTENYDEYTPINRLKDIANTPYLSKWSRWKRWNLVKRIHHFTKCCSPNFPFTYLSLVFFFFFFICDRAQFRAKDRSLLLSSHLLSASLCAREKLFVPLVTMS